MRQLRGFGLIVALAAVFPYVACQQGKSAFDLAVGDCIVVPEETGAESIEIGRVRTVDCSQPHDGEVASVFNIEGDSYPGREKLSQQVASECPSEASLFFYPTEGSWNEMQDREVACISLFDSTAVQVGEKLYGLDYFSRRLQMFVDEQGGQDAAEPATALAAVSDLIVEEEIARRFAAEMDVTAEEQEVRGRIASHLGVTAADELFDAALRGELARSGLSERDYREMIEAAVLMDKLKEKFLAQVPDSIESVRYRQIVVSSDYTGEKIAKEIESGGDFATLAAEHSLDAAAKDSGGDVGWVGRGVLGASMEEPLFDLEPGEIAVIPFHDGALVVEMLEKGRRPVAEEQRGPLADRAYDDWLNDKRNGLIIVDNVGDGGDRYKINWVVERVWGRSSASPVPRTEGRYRALTVSARRPRS